LITLCAGVKYKCAVEKGNVYTKKCRDSYQNDDLGYVPITRFCAIVNPA